MGLIWRLIKLGITLFLILLFLRSYGLKWGLSVYLQHKLGTEVSVGEVRADFVNTQAKIRDIVIRNPMVFPDGDMLLISQVFLDIKPAGLLRGQFVLELLEMEVQEIRALRAPGNGFNLYGLKIFREEKKEESAVSRMTPKLKIEKLVLSLRRGSYTDTTTESPTKKDYDFGISRGSYSDIYGLEGLGKIILTETIKKIGLAALKDLLT